MQICKYASIQVCKYASIQVCKYASMQECKFKVCRYAGMQVCKYASMQVDHDIICLLYPLQIFETWPTKAWWSSRQVQGIPTPQRRKTPWSGGSSSQDMAPGEPVEGEIRAIKTTWCSDDSSHWGSRAWNLCGRRCWRMSRSEIALMEPPCKVSTVYKRLFLLHC